MVPSKRFLQGKWRREEVAKRLQKQLSNSIVDNGNDEKRSSKEANNSKGNDNEVGKKDSDSLKPTVMRSRSVSFAQSGHTMSLAKSFALGAKPASIGPLKDPSVRKRIINLIATMNATFQDYDFSNVKPERFVRHQSYKDIMPVINKNFAEVVEIHNRGFLKILWDALDDAMSVRECEVFSYLVDDDDPKAVTGDLWSINYFFFNPSMNRMAYLKCVSKHAPVSLSIIGFLTCFYVCFAFGIGFSNRLQIVSSEEDTTI